MAASEADLLPPGFVQDHVFDFTVDGYRPEDYQRVVRAAGIKPQ